VFTFSLGIAMLFTRKFSSCSNYRVGHPKGWTPNTAVALKRSSKRRGAVWCPPFRMSGSWTSNRRKRARGARLLRIR
jgi:hypothetical protein